MRYESVDALQRALTEDIFHYAKDSKKAAGRALGTLVEIVTFYLLKSWGLEKHTAIERRLPEYGNAEITHNVEFSLHPSSHRAALQLSGNDLPITAKKIARQIDDADWETSELKPTQLLSSDEVLRNACTLYEDDQTVVVAYLGRAHKDTYDVVVQNLMPHPFAVVECKRVGVEEGLRKGPQTIEKAKQGAYVARMVSSLQKIRMSDGAVCGILQKQDGGLLCKPYVEFLRDVIASNDPEMLMAFTLTVGVVSNHGNWFTSEEHNKELKVLAQSYDWLLFLTDKGLSHFVESLLLKPAKPYIAIRSAFAESYTGKKGSNTFTKVRIALAADLALQKYFTKNLAAVEKWFNVISPRDRSIEQLKKELTLLAAKDWEGILK